MAKWRERADTAVFEMSLATRPQVTGRIPLNRLSDADQSDLARHERRLPRVEGPKMSCTEAKREKRGAVAPTPCIVRIVS